MHTCHKHRGVLFLRLSFCVLLLRHCLLHRTVSILSENVKMRTKTVDKLLTKHLRLVSNPDITQNDCTKAVPSPPPPVPHLASVRLKADHVSDGATASFLLPLVCCKRLIPANPLFSPVHPTHTHNASLK